MTARPSILAIDDDASILDFLTDALSAEYEVCTASDTRTAEDLLDQRHTDLLIVDLRMPVVDGVEFIRTLRSYRDLDRIPMLVTSAYPHFADQLTDVRVEALLAKPFALNELLRVVAETIRSGDGDAHVTSTSLS